MCVLRGDIVAVAMLHQKLLLRGEYIPSLKRMSREMVSFVAFEEETFTLEIVEEISTVLVLGPCIFVPLMALGKAFASSCDLWTV